MRRRAIIFVISLLCFGAIARAQVTCSVTTSADAFLATGSPANSVGTNLTGLNFGRAGVLFIASAASTNGEFQSILRFDFSGATNLFNSTYGTNDWEVSGMTLTLTGNASSNGEQPMNLIFPVISGGNFVIEWLSDNDWQEGTGTPKLATTDGVTYSSLPTLLSGSHKILSTNTFSPPGDNAPITYPLPLDTNVVAEVLTGSKVSLLFYAADDQIGYLFNSYNFGPPNEPLLNVTALPLSPKLLAGYFTNGWFHLVGAGAPNSNYQVQTSADLATTNWQTLQTVSADDTGSIQFDDTGASNQTSRFYRLVQ